MDYHRRVPNGSSIQLVCFDLGGVLIRICRSWAEGCRAAGVPVRSDFASDPSGANGHRQLSRRHQTGRIACAQFFQEMSATCDGLYSPAEIERIHDAWIMGEYPGVSTLIDRIHAAGVTTAALSNTNASHWRQMLAFPAFTKLGHRLASHDLGLVKPDVAVYREAERRFGVAGDRILFFDDLPDNIAAASHIGWRAATIDHAGDTAQQIEAALQQQGVL